MHERLNSKEREREKQSAREMKCAGFIVVSLLSHTHRDVENDGAEILGVYSENITENWISSI